VWPARRTASDCEVLAGISCGLIAGYTAGFAVYPGERSRATRWITLGVSSRLSRQWSAQVTALCCAGNLQHTY
jgi:hypothetical protein